MIKRNGLYMNNRIRKFSSQERRLFKIFKIELKKIKLKDIVQTNYKFLSTVGRRYQDHFMKIKEIQ